MSDDSFSDFIRRIRAGDAQAAAVLVKRYEPAIRLEVRLHLTDPRLYRLFDSMDVCQSVLASFFVRAASGQYDLDRPERLLKLLVSIAKNKVAFEARRQRAQRRDNRRTVALDSETGDLPGTEPTASRLVAGKELLSAFRQRLTAEERQLADLRARGSQWSEIAASLGGTPQARRRQLGRAADRVARELGLEDDDRG
jgi:RNA polymerase sigma-70 factor (ECF subfamily)